MTPEGRVKEIIKRVLDRYKPELIGEWPVLNGMSTPTLDYNGCFKGYSFKIEAKAPGKKLTPRQVQISKQWQAAGCKIFEIDGDVTQLVFWLEVLHNSPSASQLIKGYKP